MRVLVTGGSGFIGSHLIAEFERRRFQILNLDIAAPAVDGQRGYWLRGDVNNINQVEDVLRSFSPTAIVHMAARTDTLSPRLEDYTTNILGTKNVVECSKRFGKPKIVLVSSQFVVGPGPLPATDTDFRPHTIYGESKAEAERLLRNGLDTGWTIVRPTNVWGPFHPRYPHEFWRVVAKGAYWHPSTPKVVRSYGYVTNVAAQIAEVTTTNPEYDRRMLYVGDAPIELREWTNAFSLALTGRQVRTVPTVILGAVALAGSGARAFGVSFPLTYSRFKSMTTSYLTPMQPTLDLLGPPQTGLEAGVAQTVSWLRSSMPGFQE